MYEILLTFQDTIFEISGITGNLLHPYTVGIRLYAKSYCA